VPEISRFFGIIVSMRYDDHLPPHFHAAIAVRCERTGTWRGRDAL
jgi:hypothetical protein